MGHRTKLVSGDEWDALTKARPYHGYTAGEVKKIKRQHNKRQRTTVKQSLRDKFLAA